MKSIPAVNWKLFKEQPSFVFWLPMAVKTHSIFDPAIIIPAIGESFKKLLIDIIITSFGLA